MPLESGTYIQDLVNSNPPDGDSVSQGAAHLRLIKQVIENTFPNATKLFRFPAGVAKATGTVTVNFPGDHNKVFPVNATAAPITVNLPDCTAGGTVNEDGFVVYVVKQDNTNNAVNITPAPGQNINGATSLSLVKQNQFTILVWNKLDATWYFSKIGLTGASQNPTTQTKTTTYTLAATDDNSTIEVSGLPWTLTLPNTGLYIGFRVRVQIIGATSTNALTLQSVANIVANVPGGATVVSLRMFGFGDSADLEWDGAQWLAKLWLADPEAVGTVKTWMLETAPSAKWLLMHSAQNISRTTYAELFALWSTRFGTGDGTTTFGVPNFAGQFLRAWNNGGTVDPDAAARLNRGDGTTGDHIGTSQADQVGPHTHNVNIKYDRPLAFQGGGGGAIQNITDTGGNSSLEIGAAQSNGTTETRAKNIAVGYLLKVLP